MVATSFMPQVIGHRSPFLFMNAIFFGVLIAVIPLSFMIILGLPKQFSYLLAAPFYVFGLFIGAVPCIKYMFHCVMPLLPNPGRLCELEFSEADLGLSAFLLLWLFPTVILWMASIPNNRLAPDAIMNALGTPSNFSFKTLFEAVFGDNLTFFTFFHQNLCIRYWIATAECGG